MRTISYRILLYVVLVGFGLISENAASASFQKNRLPAFPGAEGYGAYADGGRGGQVLFVTNLEDYLPGKEDRIPGSLRAVCQSKGPRIIVFRVSGIIPLKATLKIEEPYITIAGQTAPGNGICLKNYGCVITTHDVVIRYIRIRPGDTAKKELDAITTATPSCNVIIDHCSTSWATDEVLSVSGAGQDNITVQWCIISEALDQSYHKKGAHGYGSLIRTDGHVSFHHNLYAHNRTRCPRPGTYGNENPGIRFDFRNNVIYDWIDIAGYTAADPVTMNYIGNYAKPGLSSAKNREYMLGINDSDRAKVFSSGNVVDGVDNPSNDPWLVIKGVRELNKLERPIPAGIVTTHPAEEAKRLVLEGAGASLPCRDAADHRVVEEVKAGTGHVINSQEDVGGWPQYNSAEPPKDSDLDGMPDNWEKSQKLNPHDPSDAVADSNGDGYSNIENYLNSLCL